MATAHLGVKQQSLKKHPQPFGPIHLSVGHKSVRMTFTVANKNFGSNPAAMIVSLFCV